MSLSSLAEPVPFLDDPLLRVAVAAYLARYKGVSRMHIQSDLHIFVRWCAERDIGPLTARRVDIELFVRWLQEVRRFKLSTVSRRLCVVVGFYRTVVVAVDDGGWSAISPLCRDEIMRPDGSRSIDPGLSTPRDSCQLRPSPLP